MPARIFKHACVRDLAWAGFSAPIILGPRVTGSGLKYSRFWQSHLQALDADPSTLLEFIGDAADGRLGIYYERLWHYLLQQDPDIELLAHNLPVRENGRTIGEFDCLYWSRAHNAHIHLELAVKFYLGVPDREYWLGPGGRDRLDRKLGHLTSTQGRLATQPAASEPLRKLGIESCISLIDIKGYLFVPACGMPPPVGHNPDNPLQRWYTLAEFAALEALPGHWVGWQKIPRHRWLSTHVASEGRLCDAEALALWLSERLCTGARPVQLAACDEDGVERYRCFVTPNGWPGS